MSQSRFRFRWLIGTAGLLAVASIVWFLREDRRASGLAPILPNAGDAVVGPASPTAAPSVATTPIPEPPAITVSPVAAELSTALLRKEDPVAALQAVDQLLYFYRQGLGENPVGQNEDIVTAMLGENSKRAAYLPAGSPAIRDGKLLDPWGTPYWFHPVSRDRMQIRSAGPDRELFTSDDLQNDR